jgi:hypothetical protein
MLGIQKFQTDEVQCSYCIAHVETIRVVVEMQAGQQEITTVDIILRIIVVVLGMWHRFLIDTFEQNRCKQTRFRTQFNVMRQ